MIRVPFAIAAPIRRFASHETGAATVDWVIVTAGATGAALIALEIAGGAVTGYTSGVRNEVQSPYFDTSWTSTLEIPPREYWEDLEPIVPAPEELIQTGIFDDIINPDPASDPDDDTSYPSDPTGPSDPTDPTDPPPPPPPPPPVVTSIAISNSSFEQSNHSSGNWSPGVPGWTITKSGSGDVGDFNPGSGAINQSTVTGSLVAYLYHEGWNSWAALSQTFSQTYTATATYSFSVDIGDGNYGFSGDVAYVLNIYAGSTVIGTLSGSTGDINALRTVTVTSTVYNSALNGQAIRFEIVNPPGAGGDLLVDNVVGRFTN
ncbi:hypothetical protein [Roseicyclus mahoneyensis]|uniref:Uncharacterized protein n=1 Tax=Roseicyclus mahoneyensis TaxID=164332 RepID=A0A316GMA1_9RHOB|nr:hypothetical protein [Roseicyclus mahoneyensis]PWK62145.1 hypothetical protein C7455_101171 [Roseicyclus mahoneyensis]